MFRPFLLEREREPEAAVAPGPNGRPPVVLHIGEVGPAVVAVPAPTRVSAQEPLVGVRDLVAHPGGTGGIRALVRPGGHELADALDARMQEAHANGVVLRLVTELRPARLPEERRAQHRQALRQLAGRRVYAGRISRVGLAGVSVWDDRVTVVGTAEEDELSPSRFGDSAARRPSTHSGPSRVPSAAPAPRRRPPPIPLPARRGPRPDRRTVTASSPRRRTTEDFCSLDGR